MEELIELIPEKAPYQRVIKNKKKNGFPVPEWLEDELYPAYAWPVALSDTPKKRICDQLFKCGKGDCYYARLRKMRDSVVVCSIEPGNLRLDSKTSTGYIVLTDIEDK